MTSSTRRTWRGRAGGGTGAGAAEGSTQSRVSPAGRTVPWVWSHFGAACCLLLAACLLPACCCCCCWLVLLAAGCAL